MGDAAATHEPSVIAPPSTLAELCAAEGVHADDLDALLEWAHRRADELIPLIPTNSPLWAFLAAPTRHDAVAEDIVAAGPRLSAIDDEGERLEDCIEEIDEADDGVPPPSAANEDAAAVVPTDSLRESESVARKDRRYSFEQPICVRYERWDRFLELYTKDISQGGLFVRTHEPPPLRSRVDLRIVLPDTSVRDLELVGEVIHVVTAEQSAATGMAAGFGVQLVNITPERRHLLELVVEHARAIEQGRLDDAVQTLYTLETNASGPSFRLSLSDAEHQQLCDLQAFLESARTADDYTLLQLSGDATPPEIRKALALATLHWRRQAWGPDCAPEIREVGRAIVRRLEQAAEAIERERRRRHGVQATGIPDEVIDDLTPIHLGGEPAHTTPAPQRATEPLMSRDEPALGHTTPGRHSTSAPEMTNAARSHDEAIARAVRAINEKHYERAVELLTRASGRDPGNTRALVLQRFAEARMLAKRGRVNDAMRKYEEVLELHPNHGPTERDLAILRCL